MNTTVQLGTATGIALFGTVFFARLDGGFVPATAIAVTVSVGVLLGTLALTPALAHAPDRLLPSHTIPPKGM